MCIPQDANDVIIFLGWSAVVFLIHKLYVRLYRWSRARLLTTEERLLLYAHARLNLKCHRDGCVSLHRPIN
jgi:hypothetical protein